MELHLVVPRRAVSTNQAYKRGKGSRLYLSEVAKDFKECVKAHAFVAVRSHPAWPKDLESAEVEIVTHGSRHDADGCIKLVLDGLEGVVFANDKCVKCVIARKEDDQPARVEITVRALSYA